MEADPREIAARLELARGAAEAAGKVLMAHFGRLTAVARKGAVDLVTAADHASEDHLVRVISRAFPGDAILAEERGGAGAQDAPWCWVVDPLDGTTNFVHRLDHFAVSVGLTWRGEPVAGETYHGAVGAGAWCGGRRLAVSETSDLADALVGTGFPYDRRDVAGALLAPVERALQACRGIRRFGAAALDLARVATGSLDGFWEPRLAPWDMAAGVALVREAGGRVSAYGGAPFELGGASVVASNGHIHEALVGVVG